MTRRLAGDTSRAGAGVEPDGRVSWASQIQPHDAETNVSRGGPPLLMRPIATSAWHRPRSWWGVRKVCCSVMTSWMIGQTRGQSSSQTSRIVTDGAAWRRWSGTSFTAQGRNLVVGWCGSGLHSAHCADRRPTSPPICPRPALRRTHMPQIELYVRWMQESDGRSTEPSVTAIAARPCSIDEAYAGTDTAPPAGCAGRPRASVVRLPRMHPHVLRHTFVTTMLDAGVDLRDAQIAAHHAGPRTTTRYERARKDRDRHPNYILAVYMASTTPRCSRFPRERSLRIRLSPRSWSRPPAATKRKLSSTPLITRVPSVPHFRRCFL
ncbi:site-specific integrase [Amycolatopsis sp. A133]|uniref:site-specific integrase n=1 Tax=Amycolatopsis sp. A133 TaxID=3064472 RepID=UPI0037C0FC68